MNITIAAANPAISLIFGILIFIFPRFLNYLIALYLVLNGLIGLGVLGS